jgi:hypothetical protein
MNNRKIHVDKWLWESLDLSLRIFQDRHDIDPIGIMLFCTTPKIYCLDLWIFIWNIDDKYYFLVNADTYLNIEYIILDNKLWNFVDCVCLWTERYPIYEMNVNELAKYDSQGVKWIIKKDKKVWTLSSKSTV